MEEQNSKKEVVEVKIPEKRVGAKKAEKSLLQTLIYEEEERQNEQNIQAALLDRKINF